MRQNLSLKIGSLNIQGSAKIKCETEDLSKLIHKHHIFIIEESWLEKGDACPKFSSYTSFRTERKKHPRANRNSGGIIIYISNTIVRGVTKVAAHAHSGCDAIWIKLDKYHFGLSHHIYICGGYIIPRAEMDAFELLRREIEYFSNIGKVFLIGDYNARTSSIQPTQYTLELDNHDLVSSLPIPTRNSMDTVTNENGKKLIEIATNYDLLIGNGCIMGDLEGQLTCCSWNGSSTNDLLLFHRELFSQLRYFKVDEDFHWYSDHKPISFSLAVNLISNKSEHLRSWKRVCKNRMFWNSESINKYKEILDHPITKEKFDHFNSTNFSSCDDAVHEFTSIMNEILTRVFPKKNNRRRSNHESKRESFSFECQLAKRAFKRAQRNFSNNKNCIDRRHRFIIERRNYRRAIYAAKRMTKEKQIDKLNQLEKCDSKAFWKGLKDIISPKDNSVENINRNEWVSHFDKVLNVSSARERDTQFLEYVKSSLATLESCNQVNTSLNQCITDKEIESTIKELKNGKAVFSDNIGNEALKYGFMYLKESLRYMLNFVFQKGVFPANWADGMIIPLHKKDDKTDVNNYRGIVISSCLSKVLLRILTKRIDSFMSSSGRWSLYQCGFKKDHRTEDNIFVLKTIYNNYVKEKSKDVYIAFIDFSKFFDKINREMMLYKLIKYGINGPIYSMIKSVYSKTGYQVRIGDDISPMFYGNNGLKQGCCMSPTLSSIYQNDLHDNFRTDDCAPILLGNLRINSISWADDLILMSLSKNGLQNCVLKLEEYCRKWGLEINEMKTKCMVMTKKRGTFEPIYINNMPIDYVKNIAYLGFQISNNGNFRSTIQDRIAKASRVSHMILQALRTNRNVSAKLAMNLFDKQITPILLYGSSVWSIPQTQNLCYLEGQQETCNTRRLVSNTLRSVLNRNVQFEYARRVGRRPTDNASSRKILVKLKFYSDKLELLQNSNDNTFSISEFSDTEHILEKVQHDFIKKALNVTKFSSNTVVRGELGRYPISHTAHAFAIKYWLRLCSGTENILLNEAYNVCSHNQYEFIQSIQYLLCGNGFGDVWSNPHSVNKHTFHKTFKQRLNDQYLQDWNYKLETSNRFKILQVLHSEYRIQNYINKIKNPEMREIFTRLRIDLNCLSTSKTQGNLQRELCPFCETEPEDVGHFLFNCAKYRTIRLEFYKQISERELSMTFDDFDINEKLRFVLNVECSTENIGICCRFLKRIYEERLKDGITLTSAS